MLDLERSPEPEEWPQAPNLVFNNPPLEGEDQFFGAIPDEDLAVFEAVFTPEFGDENTVWESSDPTRDLLTDTSELSAPTPEDGPQEWVLPGDWPEVWCPS